MDLWIVGQQKNNEKYREWDFVGVFDSEDKAIAICKDRSYFFSPIKLNEKAPDETVTFPGMKRIGD